MAIWLAQSIGFEFRFIDFIQGSQQSLQYYLRELQSRPYVYGTDCLPWDGGTPSLQTGRSIRDQMIAPGRRVKVMPQLKVDQGIQAARTIFSKCYFDAEKCSDGIQALRHYRYEVDKAKSDPSGKHISLSKVPLHDWAAHAADAFRAAAVMIASRRRRRSRRSGDLRPGCPRGVDVSPMKRVGEARLGCLQYGALAIQHFSLVAYELVWWEW